MRFPFLGEIEFERQKKPEVLNTLDDIQGNIVRIKTANGVEVLINPKQEDNGFYDLLELLMGLQSVNHFYDNYLHIVSAGVLNFSGKQNFGKELFVDKNRKDADGNGKSATFKEIDEELDIGIKNNDTTSEQLYWIAKYTLWINLIKRVNKTKNRDSIIAQLESDLKKIIDGQFHVDRIRTTLKGKLTVFSKGAIRRRDGYFEK